MTLPLATQPPELTGFELLRHLGGGGFADVYLYQQRRPSRQVAIKVLKADYLTDVDRAAFDGEADLMATVSAHPYIVTIFDAGISADGRPFLVMEYYRNEHVGVRAQSGMSVVEVLRTGVQVASAVEMLHHNGIVHRDIKPANILISELRKPGLTDFGIAGIQNDDPDEESRGASIPYAPPEVVSGRSNGDRRADVYSLAATLYALLARRTPFESDNPTRAQLIQRILTNPPPPLERPDVPRALELLLLQALSKDPNQRPQTAAAFALSLQGIERNLGYDPTPLEVPETDEAVPTGAKRTDGHHADSGPAGSVPPQLPSTPSLPMEGATVARPAAVVRQAPAPIQVPQAAAPPVAPRSVAARATPAPPPSSPTVARPSVVQAPPSAPSRKSAEGATVARPSLARPAEDSHTRARPQAASSPAEPPLVDVRARGPHKALVAVVAAITVVVAGAGFVVLGTSSGNARTAPQTEPTLSSDDVAGSVGPDQPTGVRVTRRGTQVLVSWDAPTGIKPDEWRIVRQGIAGPAQIARSSPYPLKGAKPGQSVCVEVTAYVSATGRYAPADVVCLQ